MLVAFDAETIVESYPKPSQDPSKPTPIHDDLIYMTVKQANVFAGQAGGELNVKAHLGDFIEWRETTMSMGDDYIALMYDYHANPNNTAESPIALPKHRLRDSVNAYLVSQAPDPAFKADPIQGHHWSTEVLHLPVDEKNKPVRFAYTFSFELIHANPGGTSPVIGFYSWDPFITVVSY
ncbi:MAG: hypothetical protein HOV94_42950 [Saccharothrix sp.]|nr:hypothetical protein [Saccharothrix sp.]